MYFKYCWVVKQPRYGKKCAKWEMYILKKCHFAVLANVKYYFFH